ncbi:MAG TPA: aminotransferase class I/II-fold pyridoxal phosphate-dependent enzyme [Kofleriaceae bacterium]
MTPIDQLVTRSLIDIPSWEVHASAGCVILDNNESPYPLDPDLAAELGAELAAVCLHRYPDPEASGLRELIARLHGVPADQVAVMNGMNDALFTLVGLFAEPRAGETARVMYVVPSYVAYRMIALRLRLEPVEVPLADDFALDEPAIERALAIRRPNVVVLARPNNPTGTLWPREVVAGLVERNPDVVFISDEAYVEFAGDDASLIDLVPRLPNLVVTRTLSKAYGMAGLRLGWAVASPAVMRQFAKARFIYNVGALNQAAAAWLLSRHRDRILARVRTIVAERERIAGELGQLPGVRVVPSHGNFLLLRCGRPGDGRAAALWQAVYRRGVLVRDFDRPGPLSGCLRVTVGTPEDNARLLDAMTAAVAALGSA